MSDCVFCGIAQGSSPATVIHSDDEVVAFHDVDPQAPTHVLVIPREHIRSAAEIGAQHDGIWARLLHVAQDVARAEGRDAYRLVVNVGNQAGQSVDHLHLHLLGGRWMAWPPG